MGCPPRDGQVSMTTLLLVRHGHVEGIKPERFRGRRDVPLSDLGLLQARATAQYISSRWHPTAIYTSPLQRCVHTGVEIAVRCRLATEVLEELNDLDYGEWQWQTREEVGSRWPEQLALWQSAPHLMRFPQGESLQDLQARSSDALRVVLRRHENKTVILVGHDSGLRVLLLQLLELPLSAYWRLAQDPCGVSEIDVSGSEVTLRRLNETLHTEAAATP